MADWSLPTLTSTYANFLAELSAKDLDSAKLLDSASVTVTNPVSGMIRWNTTNNYFEKHNGTTWAALTSKYFIDVDKVDGCTVDDTAVASTTVLWTSNKINTFASGYVTTSTLSTTLANYILKGGENGTLTLGTNDTFAVNIETANTNRLSISGTGNTTIAAPSTGVALAVTAFAGSNAITATGGGVSTDKSFTSTVATGTAPLSVTSTTVVANLNADLLDGQQGSFYQSASNINAGTLPVSHGGTGVATITGLVKGTGTTAMTTAVAGTDYVIPSGSITGNASTATALQTSRLINGIGFTGAANINIEARLGSAIASAATTNIGTVDTTRDIVHITGVTTITSFGISTTGAQRTLIFDGILTVSHNATSLILPASANITTAVGDTMVLVCENGGTGYWRCLSYRDNTIGNLEYSYLNGVTSSIQDQFTGKEPAFTTLPVSKGGTGSSTALVQGGIKYASSTTAEATSAVGTAGYILTSGGTGIPTWAINDLSLFPSAAFKKECVVATTADIATSTGTAQTLTGYSNTQTLALTTTAGSTTVTTTSTAGLKVGAVVNTATADVAAGTTVAAITNSTTFVVNNRANITTTAITGNGTTATATFAAQTYAPYAVGSTIVISGTTPTTYSGSKVVTACTTTTVQFASTETVTATVQGTIAFTISAGTSVSTSFTQTIAALTIDGITLALNDRALIKDQSTLGGIASDARYNGVYYLSTLGTTSVPWVLTRVVDGSTADNIAAAIVNINKGTTNYGQIFSNRFKNTDTLGATLMPWYQVLTNQYITGTGNVVFSASPTFTGVPVSTTATAGTNTTQIATTAYVQSTITGVVSKTGLTGGTVVLTADESANPVIELSGVLTSNLIIELPVSAQRVYSVSNTTTGAFTTSIKVTGLTPSVLVAQGKRNLIYVNTLGAYDAINDFDSIALTGTTTANVITGTSFNSITGLSSTATDIKINGTQAAGALTTVARADHVHPSDTAKANLASPALTGTPTAPTATGTTNTTQIATTAHVKTAYASADGTLGGVVKMRISGSVLYIRTDGTNA